MAFQTLRLAFVLLTASLILGAYLFPSAAAEPSWPPVHSGTGQAEAKIRNQLDALTKIQFDGERLDEVREYLQNLHGITIVLDKNALEAINITSESLVTIDVQGISLRSGLRLLMRGIDPTLTFVIQDEVLMITTKEAEEQVIVQRVYDVSALLKNGETAQDLATSLERTFHRQPQRADAAPQQEPAKKEPGSKAEQAEDTSQGPLISGHRSALMVRGTESQQEEVVRLLRGLKELADTEKGRRGPLGWHCLTNDVYAFSWSETESGVCQAVALGRKTPPMWPFWLIY